jgi:putative transposase
MNNYNPNIHHRRSIRLKGYDYSQEGLYFITINTKDRECLFGEIVDGKMVLNDAGKIANKCWLEIPKHFPDTVLHDHIVMPNHVHGIIELIKMNIKKSFHIQLDQLFVDLKPGSQNGSGIITLGL